MELELKDDLGKISMCIEEPGKPMATIIIAHGAGAGMNHPFMTELTKEFYNNGIRAIRFNFPYMEQGKKSPGSQAKNVATWRQVIDFIFKKYPNEPIYIGGKSYGGRMASHLLLTEKHASEVNGVIYFGFPLHAPGKESKERADHLSTINQPQLFLQGTNDKLANIVLMREVVKALNGAKLFEIPDGDHSFKVPKRSNKSPKEIFSALVSSSLKFIEET